MGLYASEVAGLEAEVERVLVKHGLIQDPNPSESESDQTTTTTPDSESGSHADQVTGS